MLKFITSKHNRQQEERGVAYADNICISAWSQDIILLLPPLLLLSLLLCPSFCTSFPLSSRKPPKAQGGVPALLLSIPRTQVMVKMLYSRGMSECMHA